MSEDNAKTGKGLAWCIGIGVALMLLGSFANNDKKSTTTTDNNSNTYHPTAWCEEHKDDRWRGEVDNDEVMRYIHECRGK